MENINKKADKATAIGVLQYIMGALIFIICMILSMVTSFLMQESIVPTVLMVSGIAAGTLLTCKGVINYKRASRYRRINKAMDGAKNVELTGLQSKLGWPKDKIISAIKNQIAHGYWPDAHLDTEKGMFMLGYNPSHVATDTGNTATDELLNEANAHLHDMATTACTIEDEQLREQAERLIDIATQIYKAVEKAPDKQSNVRQLTNYFLPTTSKLLTDYADLQNQSVKSDNMLESMQKIKEAMQAIEESFKKQQTAVFDSKALDISVEIDVLKKMMK